MTGFSLTNKFIVKKSKMKTKFVQLVKYIDWLETYLILPEYINVDFSKDGLSF